MMTTVRVSPKKLRPQRRNRRRMPPPPSGEPINFRHSRCASALNEGKERSSVISLWVRVVAKKFTRCLVRHVRRRVGLIGLAQRQIGRHTSELHSRFGNTY